MVFIELLVFSINNKTMMKQMLIKGKRNRKNKEEQKTIRDQTT